MEILLSNFYKYDWIIFALGAVNMIVFFVAMRRARKLVESVAPRINVSSGNVDEAVMQAKQDSSYYSLYEKWQKAEFTYNLFCNLTSIFTLLGILGTVLSLIHLVDSTADINMEFLGALTSTMWGIIFTIVFKVLDTAISFDLDLGERISELVQMREYKEKEDKEPADKKKPMEQEGFDELEDFSDLPDQFRVAPDRSAAASDRYRSSAQRVSSRERASVSEQRIPAPSERIPSSSKEQSTPSQKRGGWKK